MGVVKGTGEKAAPRRRIRLPRFSGPTPTLVVVVLTPIAVLAPDAFLRSVAIAVIVGLAYIVGHYEGRSAHARDDIRTLYDRGQSDVGRRDVPTA